jgi:tryptophan synthase alpha chain
MESAAGYSPESVAEWRGIRMRYLASLVKGFIYCVARKGVTGAKTAFSEELLAYLGR